MPTDYLAIMYRLLAAALVGCVIGVERNLHGKPTGIKTLGLVSLGSALVTMASMDFTLTLGDYDMLAVSRAIQGVITGVGFLGAGVIIYNQGSDTVYGLTTAASIWVTAALGVVCGMGQWPIAAGSVIVLLLLFVLGRIVEKKLLDRWSRKPVEERKTLSALDE